MPIQSEYVNATKLICADTASQSEDKHNAQHDQTRGDVKRMQSDERIVGRSEKIG